VHVRVFFMVVLAHVALGASPDILGAQQASSLRAAPFASPAPDVGALAAPQAPVAGKKSPVAAGLLSLWIPGVGSFYAENRRHGWRHLAIHGASIGVMVASCNPGVDSCGAVGAVGLLAFVGNIIWAPVTAVFDAHAANRKAQ
jgi:hypothetical protein